MDNATYLDIKISENITSVYSIIAQGNSKLSQSIAHNATILDNRIYNNVSSLNQTLTDNISTLNMLVQKLQGQIDILQNKQDKLPQEMLGNMFQQENYEVTELWMVCGQPSFIQTFDILSVTNTIIASNFTNGSVFGSLINVQNAFIDIQGGVYSSVVQSLFAAQNQFYNLKVQVATQIVQNGHILSSSNAIIINQLTILSKVGTIITINSMLQLCILQTLSVNTNIKDMKVNLDVEASSGNLGLVGSLTGQLNIINYQISGIYETQGSMSLGVSNLSSSKVLIKHMNFAPLSYTYGNQSSYIFIWINICSIEISRSIIVVGNEDTQFSLGSLASTSTKQQQFGGLISQMFSTRLITTELSYTSNVSCNTQYMKNSGLLLGLSTQSSNQIYFQQICLFSNINATTQFSSFGVFGQIDGNITLKQSTINTNIYDQNELNCYGIVGYITNQSIFTSFLDINIIANIFSVLGGNNAGLVGQLYSITSIVQNISLNNSVLNNIGLSGGLIGLVKSNLRLFNIEISNCLINSSGNSGAVIGQSIIHVNILQNIKVTNIVIESIQYVGGFIAFSDSDVNINNGMTTNLAITSSSNLGGQIGYIQVNRTTTVFDVNASYITIISLTACSTGSIVGIACVGTNSLVNNSQVRDINISANGGGGTAGIIGFSQQNVSVFQSRIINIIINSKSQGTGCIIGQSNISLIDNCQVFNSQIIASFQAGGLIGFVNYNALIRAGIASNISISASQQAGGIIGCSKVFIAIQMSSVNNTYLNSKWSVAGGFVGTVTEANFDQCKVNNVDILSSLQCGGLVGSMILTPKQMNISQVEITNINLNNSAAFSIGGIVGISVSVINVSKSFVQNVTITSANCSGVGGIIGYNTANTFLFNNTVNNLYLNSNATGSGGLIGNSNITNIINCQTSDIYIYTTRSAGGVIGFSFSNITILDNSLLSSLQNVEVQNIMIVYGNIVGGFIGYFNSSQQLIISNCIINQINISSNMDIGVVIGKSISSQYSIVNSSSIGQNILNNVVQTNCPQFIITENINGC
ncbi:Conserved_hypothetical protein [Hexamita inflata]|uniref:Uncharacterized protein n=1 Tax=Hexamita inflata TaxID=28002 RepID=A0AA86UVH0_9EUKA|nr:Conserved hypothetical protein [Hexamita inflata]